MDIPKIEFISYSGKFPNLCSGKLVISVNGTLYILKNVMITGGGCNYRENYIGHGPWSIDNFYVPEEIKKYCKEIENIVNNNVVFGCCGGCI
jgi:hypothetical protein